MHRLFWKIFAAFWTTVVSLLLVIFVLEWFVPLEPPSFSHQALLDEALKAETFAAVSKLKAGGAESLNDELAAFEERTGVEAFWLDSRGKEPAETAFEAPIVTPIVREVAIQAAATPAKVTSWRIVGFSVYAGVKAPVPNAVLVVRLDRAGLSRSTPSRVIRISVALLTASIACWLLTRHLVAPIEALRSASQRLAEGDLAARVVPAPSRRRRDEIALLARDFDQMARQMQSLVDAQRRLLRDVSHELRSPLTRLRLSLSLMNRVMPPELANNLAPHRERIEGEIAALDALIGELLTLSRLEDQLESSAGVSFATTVDLVSCVREVVTELEWEIGQKAKPSSVTFETELAMAVMPGDAALMKRALSNLALNSLRYVPEHGNILFQLSKNEVGWQLVVADDGPGVPEAELEDIFQPFYRVEDAQKMTSSDAQRSGLGLAIARRAVMLHGGSLVAKNRKPHGLEMLIDIPDNGTAS